MVPFLFALSFHECAHALVARNKGDNTAFMLGRLTLNPISHIDIVGTVLLPTMALFLNWPLLGWAKPVPVNSRNLNNVKNDIFWIALAGPLSNVILAIIGSILMHALVPLEIPEAVSTPLFMMLNYFIIINLFLALFNLLPVHPLDGGKILGRFLPHTANVFLEENQFTTQIVLFILVFSKGLTILSVPVYWLASFLIPS